jgi:hypothetical protein
VSAQQTVLVQRQFRFALATGDLRSCGRVLSSCLRPPSLPAYLVHDAGGNYAVFDADGHATYFQPLVPSAEAWTALLHDWHATQRRFESLLRPLLQERARQASSADRLEHEGATLEMHPVRSFERPNLRFVQSDLDAAQEQPADVVRCFNMLLCFDDAFRVTAMNAFGRLMREDGLLVCGTDWAHTTESRYFTYRKRGGVLRDGEFAFSLDNVSPIAIIRGTRCTTTTVRCTCWRSSPAS